MRILLLFFVLLIGTSPIIAQTGLQLLTVSPSSMELSRAETSTAIPNGAHSIYSNPALLAMEERPSISLSYTNWISDSNNLFGGINLVKGKRSLAFSFYTSGVSGLEQRNGPGPSNGDFTIQYLSISGAYAYNFDYFSVGVSGHYINEEIFPYSASGYAFNAGVASSLIDDRLHLGISALNFGNMEDLNEDPTDLPSSIKLGAAFDVIELTHNKNPQLPILITVMSDFVIPVNETDDITDINPTENYFNIGMSLLVADIIRVNSGYKTEDNVRPLSFGIDLLLEKMSVNYALVPFNTGFGTVHSIGIQYQL